MQFYTKPNSIFILNETLSVYIIENKNSNGLPMNKDYIIDFRNSHPNSDQLQAVINFSQSEKSILDVLYRLRPRSDYEEIKSHMIALQDSITDNVINKQLYPSDFELALFANLAYENLAIGEHINSSTPLGNFKNTGWTVEQIFDFTNSTGFSSTLFANHNLKQVVLAHRGTFNEHNIATDFSVVLGLNPFATEVEQSYNATTKAADYAYEQGYYLSVTGHSLGGFYAELSADTIFNHGLRYHVPPRIVTFDSPGAFEFLVAEQESNGMASYRKSSKDFENLGVINYSLAPNLVNTVNTHVGTNILVRYQDLQIPRVDDRYFCEKYNDKLCNELISVVQGENVQKSFLRAIAVTLTSHPLSNIIKAFDPNSGSLIYEYAFFSLSWPKQPIDYFSYHRDKKPAEEFVKLYNNVLSVILSCYLELNDGNCSYFKGLYAAFDILLNRDVSAVTSSNAFISIVNPSVVQKLGDNLFTIEDSWHKPLSLINFSSKQDLFWSETRFNKWSADPMILRLFEGSNSCKIFQIDIYNHQCSILKSDVTIHSHLSVTDSKKITYDLIETHKFTPNQVREWFYKIMMVSEYAAFKLTNLISEKPIDVVATKLMDSQRSYYKVFPSRQKDLDEIIDQKKVDYNDDTTDYLICGGGGIGKSIFMNSLANKLNTLDKPKYWVSDGDLVSGVAKLFESIFMASTKWMRFTNSAFETMLAKKLIESKGLLSDIVFIIDNIDSEKLQAQKSLLMAMAKIEQVRFIFSSEDCDLYHEITALIHDELEIELGQHSLEVKMLDTPSTSELTELFHSYLTSTNSTKADELVGIIDTTGHLPINFIRALDFSKNLPELGFRKFMLHLDSVKDHKYNTIGAILHYLQDDPLSSDIFTFLTGLMLISNPQVISSENFEVANIQGESFEYDFTIQLFELISQSKGRDVIDLLKNANIIEINDKNSKELTLHKGAIVELYLLLKEIHKDKLLNHLVDNFDLLVSALDKELIETSIYNFLENKQYQYSLAMAVRSFVDESWELFISQEITANAVNLVKVIKKIAHTMELSSQHDSISYFTKALKLLMHYHNQSTSHEISLLKADLNFRLAEIFHGLMDLPTAKNYYANTLKLLNPVTEQKFYLYVEMLHDISTLQMREFSTDQLSKTWDLFDSNVFSFENVAEKVNIVPNIISRKADLISGMLMNIPVSGSMQQYLLPIAVNYLKLLSDFRNSYNETYLPHFIELDLEIAQLSNSLQIHGLNSANVNPEQSLANIFSSEDNVGILRAEALLRAIILEGHYSHEAGKHSKSVDYLKTIMPILHQTFEKLYSSELSHSMQLYLSNLASKALKVGESFLGHVRLNYEFCPIEPDFDDRFFNWLEVVKYYAEPAFSAITEAYQMSMSINDYSGLKNAAALLLSNYSLFIKLKDDKSFSHSTLVKAYITSSFNDAFINYTYNNPINDVETLGQMMKVSSILSKQQRHPSEQDIALLNDFGTKLLKINAPNSVIAAVYGLAYSFIEGSVIAIKNNIIAAYVKSALAFCDAEPSYIVKNDCGSYLKSIVVKEQAGNTALRELQLLQEINEFYSQNSPLEEQCYQEIHSFSGSLQSRKSIDKVLADYYTSPLKAQQELNSPLYFDYSKVAERMYFVDELI